MTNLYVYFKKLDPTDGVSVGFDLGLQLMQKDHDYNHVVVMLGTNIVEQTLEGPVLLDAATFDASLYPLCVRVYCNDTYSTVLDRLTTLFALNLHLTPQDLILWSLGYRPIGSLFCTDLVLMLLGESERKYLTPCELLSYLKENYSIREFHHTQSLPGVR